MIFLQKKKRPALTVVIPLGLNRELLAIESLKKQSERLLIIVERGDNPSRNRNVGAQKVRTPYIAFINAHSLPPKDWAQKAVRFLEENKEIDVVGGPQKTSRGDSLFERASGYALASRFGTANVSERYSGSRIIIDSDESQMTSANLICRRKVINTVRFDEKLWPGEDPKFIYDIKKAGFRTAFDPDLYVLHKRRSTFSDFAKQIYNYGKSRSSKLRSTILRKPMFMIPPLFLIYLLVLPTLLLIHWATSIPLLLYLMAAGLFSVAEAIRNKDLETIILMPFCFIIIHISYGAGMIVGFLGAKLIKFI